MLRVGGIRPVLLQTSVGAQLPRRHPDDQPVSRPEPGRQGPPGSTRWSGGSIGITRERLIGAEGVAERLKVVNHAARESDVPVELELGADGADIFEVRGYPRPSRGTLLPVAVIDDRVTFRYLGLDGVERFTHIAFSEPADIVEPVDQPRPDGSDVGAAVRLRWTLDPWTRRDARR